MEGSDDADLRCAGDRRPRDRWRADRMRGQRGWRRRRRAAEAGMQAPGGADDLLRAHHPAHLRPLLRPRQLPHGGGAGAGPGPHRGGRLQPVGERPLDGAAEAQTRQPRPPRAQLPGAQDRGRAEHLGRADAERLPGLTVERGAVPHVRRDRGHRPVDHRMRAEQLIPLLVALVLSPAGATNREAFGMIRGFLPWDTYVKAGRLFPAYGLRVQDDQAFIRARTGYTFQTPDEGGEIGIQPGPFFLASSITNGAAGDKDVAATANGYTMLEDVPIVRHVLAGASFARQSNKRYEGGFYGGSNWWRFTYLGEIDWINDRKLGSPGRNDKYAAYGEADFLLFDWLNLRGIFEFVKVTRDRDQTRYAIGAEPFVNRVIQPRIQYRINNGIASQPNQNRDELWLELHFFL